MVFAWGIELLEKQIFVNINHFNEESVMNSAICCQVYNGKTGQFKKKSLSQLTCIENLNSSLNNCESQSVLIGSTLNQFLKQSKKYHFTYKKIGSSYNSFILILID